MSASLHVGSEVAILGVSLFVLGLGTLRAVCQTHHDVHSRPMCRSWAHVGRPLVRSAWPQPRVYRFLRPFLLLVVGGSVPATYRSVLSSDYCVPRRSSSTQPCISFSGSSPGPAASPSSVSLEVPSVTYLTTRVLLRTSILNCIEVNLSFTRDWQADGGVHNVSIHRASAWPYHWRVSR